MDTLFSEILQLVAKALIVYLLARSAKAAPVTYAQTRISRKAPVVRKTIAPKPPATPRVTPPRKKVTQ